jgi:DNA-binding transcriptional ArsR family regulator
LRPRSSAAKGLPAEASALVFAALADGTRLRLASRLSIDGPLNITELTRGSRVTRQAIRKHLRTMEEAGLVHVRRRGRESVFDLDTERLDNARRHLDLISKQWAAALDRLRMFVDG